MRKFKDYKHVIGKTEDDLVNIMAKLYGLGYRLNQNRSTGNFEARRRVGDFREVHIIIKEIKRNYVAYLHIEDIISDTPRLIHRVVRDPNVTAWWGNKVFGGSKK